MSLRLTFAALAGNFDDVVGRIQRPMAKAVTLAIIDAADNAKNAGRAQIAAAGFSSKWQNAFRADVFPKGGSVFSMNAAALVFHKIHYADVFEHGATIAGTPYLWLPTANAPQRLGGQRISVRQYLAQVGPLEFARRSGKPPLLIAKLRIKGKATARKVRQAGLIAGASEAERSIPMFIGLPVVNIPKKFDLLGAIARAAAQLPDLYVAHLEPEQS
jgi:Family of unknown function (DUF6441)